MNQLYAVQLLLKQAREARNSAAKTVADALVWRDNSRQKFDMLNQYRSDYLTHLENEFGQVAKVSVLSQHTAFVGKLEEAIDQQTRDMEFREQALESARLRLMDCERRIRSLQLYVERLLRTEALKENRREQKAMDEFAALAASRISPSY